MHPRLFSPSSFCAVISVLFYYSYRCGHRPPFFPWKEKSKQEGCGRRLDAIKNIPVHSYYFDPVLLI